MNVLDISVRGIGLLTVLLFASCRYEVPLETNTQLPVDTRLEGTWRKPGGERDERIQIVPFTDRQYLVNYHIDENVLYLRGYMIEFNSNQYVQVEFIATPDKIIKGGERKFDIFRYELSGNTLSVWRVNGDVVSESIDSTRTLREAFQANADSRDLFVKFAEFEKTD